MVNPNIFSMPRPPRADTVFHEFTCPIMVDGNLVAEIDMGADITKTYDGHAAFFDSNSGAGDPGSEMEFEVDAVLFQDLNDDMHRWHFADAYLTKQALDYLHSDDAYDSVCATLKGEG